MRLFSTGRTAACDAGDAALSGGYSGEKTTLPTGGTGYLTPRSTTNLASSYRSTNPGSEHVWQFHFTTGANPDSLTVHAVCADLPPLRP